MRFLNYLFPHRCLFCKQAVNTAVALCQACRPELPWHPQDTEQIILFYYQKPIDRLIKILKFHHQLIVANWFGQLMLERIKERCESDRPQLIIPIPLHRKRLKQRGYNQALEIAKPISRQLHIAIATDFIQRVKNTLPQSELKQRDRVLNVKNAFALHRPSQVSHIAIIDDVITTGSTIKEVSDLARDHGIKRIEHWCCAISKAKDEV